MRSKSQTIIARPGLGRVVENQFKTTGSGKTERPVKPVRLKNEPALTLAPEPWDKHRARKLDPSKVLRLRGQTPPRPTLYAGDTLLLRGLVADDSALQILRDVAAPHYHSERSPTAEALLVDAEPTGSWGYVRRGTCRSPGS
jgi:hypothetical protein